MKTVSERWLLAMGAVRDVDMVSELLSVRRSPFCRDLA
jgi:hypothetical protein